MVAISIIMPVYNGERYLAEAISSILNQTFKDFELIIVNDGSTDGSTSIVRKYMLQDKRIVFVDRKQNKKLPYTLNEGISLSKGKYISRMDSDDIAFSEKLSEELLTWPLIHQANKN
mgnify:CR=1 FL=1